MRAQRERHDDEPAFVLHGYPYRETSIIVEIAAAFSPTASASYAWAATIQLRAVFRRSSR
jgi:hypothetical protein